MTPREIRQAYKANAQAMLARYEAEGSHNDRFIPDLYQDDPAPRVKGYTPEDTDLNWVRDIPSDCWIWDGPFKFNQRDECELPYIAGIHDRCGIAHMSAYRAIFEDYLGRILARDEVVRAICATNRNPLIHRCVNPEHHVLKEIQS